MLRVSYLSVSIHGYDVVSDDVIWLIVNKSLPILDQEVKKLLK